MYEEPLKNHYQQIASAYDTLWVHSNEYTAFMTENIVKHLELKSDDKIVDLGSGTGIYGKAVSKMVRPRERVLCVDASLEMLQQVASEKSIETLCMLAEDFVKRNDQYDKIFMKEVVHHIDEKKPFFRDLASRLSPEGSFLLILLPPRIEYPLFKAALMRYEQLQPNYHDLDLQLQSTGFATNISFVEYLLSIPRERYFDMVRNRYMSLLSLFNDDELQKGLEEMKLKYPQKQLEFRETFVFIKATKDHQRSSTGSKTT